MGDPGIRPRWCQLLRRRQQHRHHCAHIKGPVLLKKWNSDGELIGHFLLECANNCFLQHPHVMYNAPQQQFPKGPVWTVPYSTAQYPANHQANQQTTKKWMILSLSIFKWIFGVLPNTQILMCLINFIPKIANLTFVEPINNWTRPLPYR